MPRPIPLSTAVIPRFLLPRQGSIWLRPTSIRNASNKADKAAKAAPKPKGPIVLEKPTKFNPPSHPQRRAKPAPRYPGPNLSAEETERMATKKYPNMMPAEGTFMHWFINNRNIHMWITLVRLCFLLNFTNSNVMVSFLRNNWQIVLPLQNFWSSKEPLANPTTRAPCSDSRPQSG